MVCLSVIFDSSMSSICYRFCRKLFLRYPLQIPIFISSPSLKVILKITVEGCQKVIKPAKIDDREFVLEYNVGFFYLENKNSWETFRPHEDCLVLYSVEIQFAIKQENNPEILFPA